MSNYIILISSAAQKAATKLCELQESKELKIARAEDGLVCKKE